MIFSDGPGATRSPTWKIQGHYAWERAIGKIADGPQRSNKSMTHIKDIQFSLLVPKFKPAVQFLSAWIWPKPLDAQIWHTLDFRSAVAACRTYKIQARGDPNRRAAIADQIARPPVGRPSKSSQSA
jgi:hypothetical protein